MLKYEIKDGQPVSNHFSAYKVEIYYCTDRGMGVGFIYYRAPGPFIERFLVSPATISRLLPHMSEVTDKYEIASVDSTIQTAVILWERIRAFLATHGFARYSMSYEKWVNTKYMPELYVVVGDEMDVLSKYTAVLNPTASAIEVLNSPHLAAKAISGNRRVVSPEVIIGLASSDADTPALYMVADNLLSKREFAAMSTPNTGSQDTIFKFGDYYFSIRNFTTDPEKWTLSMATNSLVVGPFGGHCLAAKMGLVKSTNIVELEFNRSTGTFYPLTGECTQQTIFVAAQRKLIKQLIEAVKPTEYDELKHALAMETLLSNIAYFGHYKIYPYEHGYILVTDATSPKDWSVRVISHGRSSAELAEMAQKLLGQEK